MGTGFRWSKVLLGSGVLSIVRPTWLSAESWQPPACGAQPGEGDSRGGSEPCREQEGGSRSSPDPTEQRTLSF